VHGSARAASDPGFALPPNPTPSVHHSLIEMFGPLGPSFASQIRSSKSLYAWLKPVATWYTNVAGYRKVGLKYDDLRACLSGPNLRSLGLKDRVPFQLLRRMRPFNGYVTRNNLRLSHALTISHGPGTDSPHAHRILRPFLPLQAGFPGKRSS
jgi:hypothetical protein